MKQQQSATSQSSQSNIIAIITMCFLFAMIAFVTNLAAPVGTIWAYQYDWAGMLGNLANFLAYLFMGIPAGIMLSRISYKKTALVALAIGFVGMGCQYASSMVGGGQGIGAMIVYLIGAFISGFCVCILNTVVNPMLNLIGHGGKRGNQLIQIGSSCNSLAGTVAPLLVGMLIGQVTKSTSIADVTPLLLIAMAIFVVAFFIIGSLKLYEPQTAQRNSANDTHSPWSFRHTVLGVIGIFCYVGMEVGIPGVLIFYLSDPVASGITQNGVAIAGGVVAIYWLLMLAGRFASSFISGAVSSRAQLIAVSAVGLALVLAAIFTGDSVSILVPAWSIEEGFTTANVPIAALFLVLCGLCTSVMWGAIFNLAVEGLGKYTAKASGIFMMMVVGGGVIPFLMNLLAKDWSYMGSYWIVVAILLYLLFYAVAGSKNVNTDIPVEDEAIAPDPRDL